MIFSHPAILSTRGGFRYNNVCEYSAMFDSVSNTYLGVTSTDGSNTTCTHSIWVKRSRLTGSGQMIFSMREDDNDEGRFGFGSSDQFYLARKNSGSTTVQYSSNAVFKDCSGWYHVLVASDCSNVVAAERVRVYINNVRITDWATENTPSLNESAYLCRSSSTTRNIGRRREGTEMYFNGYMAEYNYIDGSALTPGDFGEEVNGIWIPKTYTGAYPNNSHRLTFADNTHFGDDTSGEANDWADNNFGTDHQVIDTPENNYCTLEYNNTRSNITSFTEGAKFIGDVGAAWHSSIGTFLLKTGKWYWEVEILDNSTNSGAGVLNTGEVSGDIIISDLNVGTSDNVWLFHADGANNKFTIWNNDGGTDDDNLAAPTNNQWMQVAFDADANKLWFGFNGTWGDFGATGIGDPANGTNPAYSNMDAANYGIVPFCSIYGNANGVYVNFGQRAFTHTPPTGFKALCTENLPKPSIIQPAIKAFNTITWSGDDDNPRSLTGVGFQPDLVWLKNRNNTANFLIADALRGADNMIYSNTDGPQSTPINGYINGFEADGFSVDEGGATANNVNLSGRTYVAWCFKEGPRYGLDIVQFTGTGIAHAEDHDLGVVPEMIILKNTTDTQAWRVFHNAAQNKTDPETDYGVLDTDAAWADSPVWNDVKPTSTQFTVGSGNGPNGDGDAIIAYLFASIAGFSKVFSFEGNGNAAGPYVYCGFRPAWIILKNADDSHNWNVRDNMRDPYNPSNFALWPDITTAESGTSADVDIYANGFKLRHVNWVNNQTYVGIAFAGQPFKYSNAR